LTLVPLRTILMIFQLVILKMMHLDLMIFRFSRRSSVWHQRNKHEENYDYIEKGRGYLIVLTSVFIIEKKDHSIQSKQSDQG
jgi:hypothetical protein